MQDTKEKLEVKRENGKIYAPLKDKWLVETPEEKVRQNYICHLVNEYGYQLEQMEQELQVSNSLRGTGAARADIVIWKNEEERKARKSAFIVVECKAENVTIRKGDYFQGANYASWVNAPFFVVTNEKETKYFTAGEVIPEKYPNEIVAIPKAQDVNNEKKIQEILKQLKKFERDEFQKLLFECHNVIRNNDKFSPEMAFDEISKVLFMKIRYEREQNSIFSKERFETLKKAYLEMVGEKKANEVPFYQHFFEQTKDVFEKDEIFTPTDTLRIRETSFLQIVKKLEKYNLSDTSDDVKGIAFEEFLGKTFRGDLGQFFTPRTLVDFMVGLLDPQEGELIADPCCGTGGFLIKAFEYVREKIEDDIQAKKELFKQEFLPENFGELSEKKQDELLKKFNQISATLNKELEPNEKQSRLNHLSYNCIFGTDAEPRSARTAKMNMIMHGDGHGGVHNHDGLLNINGIYDNRFDVIVTNPPFGASVSKELMVRKKEIEPKENYAKRYGKEYEEIYKQNIDFFGGHKKLKEEGLPLLEFYETGKMSGLTEVLFVERCLNLLRKGGRMGIVLPEGFLNGSNLQKVRDFVESKAKILAVVSVPQDVFISAGATVKSSLVFLKKFSQEEESQYQNITIKVTDEIDAKYQPEIEAIESKYEAIKVVHENIKATIKDLKKQLKAKDADKPKIRKQIEENTKTEKQERVNVRIAKKERDSNIKEIEAQKEAEIKAEIKKRFSYDFPIIQVEKAGISSTGQKIDNELVEVKDEFAEYKKMARLWDTQSLQYSYQLDEKGKLQKSEELVNF